MYRKDKELGLEVKNHLIEEGIENPTIEVLGDQKKEVEKFAAKMLESIGIDLSNSSTKGTPRRLAKMFVDELFWGLNYDNFPALQVTEDEYGVYDSMIIEKAIPVKSMCEHHLMPIKGICSIAYIPNKKILGLSKLNRVVRFFSRRPQIQERLTEQIHAAMAWVLETDDVAVHMSAEHFCVSHRGVEDHGTVTETMRLSGAFKEDPAARSEFTQTVNK